MARPRKINRNRPHASPSNKSIDSVGSDTQDPRYRDEFLFYRALARHTIGDPAYHESILHAVQTHYWRVLVDKSNPYHDVYASFEKIEFGPVGRMALDLSCRSSLMRWTSRSWYGKELVRLLFGRVDQLNFQNIMSNFQMTRETHVHHPVLHSRQTMTAGL